MRVILEEKVVTLVVGKSKFISVYKSDAIILAYVLGYKLVRGKVGFPKCALDKVLGKLTEVSVSFKVVSGDNVKEVYAPKVNAYDSVLLKANKNLDSLYSVNEVINVLSKCSSEKLKKIMEFIKNEG